MSQDTTPAVPQPLEAFAEFAASGRYMWQWIAALFGAASLTAFVGLIGPPWPAVSAIALFTVIFQTIAYIWCFTFYLQRGMGLARLERRLKFGLSAVALSVIIYIVAYTTLVLHLDDKGNTEARGFVYTELAVDYQRDYPGTTDEELIMEAGNGRAAKVFTVGSLMASRLIVLFNWLLSHFVLSYSICTFVVLQYLRSRRSRAGAPDHQ